MSVRTKLGFLWLITVSSALSAFPAWGGAQPFDEAPRDAKGLTDQLGKLLQTVPPDKFGKILNGVQALVNDAVAPEAHPALTADDHGRQILRQLLLAALQRAGGEKLTLDQLKKLAVEICETLIHIANKDATVTAADTKFAEQVASDVFANAAKPAPSSSSSDSTAPPPPPAPSPPQPAVNPAAVETVIQGPLAAELKRSLIVMDKTARKASIDNHSADLSVAEREAELTKSIDTLPANNQLLRKVRTSLGKPDYTFTDADRTALKAMIKTVVGGGGTDTPPAEPVASDSPPPKKPKPTKTQIIEEVEEVLVDAVETAIAPSPLTIGALVVDSAGLLIDSGVLTRLGARCRARYPAGLLGTRSVIAPLGRGVRYYYVDR